MLKLGGSDNSAEFKGAGPIILVKLEESENIVDDGVANFTDDEGWRDANKMVE